MKFCLPLEKKASSALVFATLGCLVANLAPAHAATNVLAKTVTEPVESPTQEAPTSLASPASTDVSMPTEKTEVAPVASQLTATNLAKSLSTASSSVAESDASVPTTTIAASGLAATPTTNALSELEVTPSSTQTVHEARVEDLKSPDYLQAQSLPAEADVNEPSLIDPVSLDPVEPGLEENPMGQVTNVSQLRDVSPGDWAYEALRSLVERYGCIAGYPDGTFRGNRAMSRYEFAAGLNACLQQVERLIAGIDSGVSREDFESLQRLVQEFQTELTALGTRVDSLEGRVGVLEDRQFSTTTKLFGQAIIGLQGRSGSDYVLSGNKLPDDDTNINVIDNVQLSLFTQFSPRTLLLTSFQAGEGSTTSVATRDPLGNYVGLGYEGDTDNNLELTDLNVRHLFGSNFAVIVGPEGVNPVNVFRGVNRIESAGSGPLSRFAQRNPIINIGRAGAGIGFDWQAGSRLSLQGVYSASRGEDPNFGGIFGGDEGSTAAGAQVVFSPTDKIDLSLQYINSYSPDGFLGTGVGDDRVALQTVKVNGDSAFLRAPINTNAFGANIEWRVMPKLTAGGWLGFTDSNYQDGSGDVQTFNWMAFLNFPDLFGEGNLGGLYVGQPPRITDSDIKDNNGQGRNVPGFFSQSDITKINPSEEGGQPDTTIHLEAFYRLRVNDNISITPGVIVLLNPLHNNDNDTITIGAIRTTFTF